MKRSIDILFSFLLLLAALPLLLVCAILIKLDSEGSVLFRQPRMGRGFRCFQLVKLRTMSTTRPGCQYTFGADPRVTRAGRWMRKYKLDELPQLWNVLRGEMSLVGPRPVIPELALEFRPQYGKLLAVRPGLTDPATLKYYRESEMLAHVPDPMAHFKTVVTPDKLRISTAYLDCANVGTDLAIMLKTAVVLISLSLQAAQKMAPASAVVEMRRTS